MGPANFKALQRAHDSPSITARHGVMLHEIVTVNQPKLSRKQAPIPVQFSSE